MSEIPASQSTSPSSALPGQPVPVPAKKRVTFWTRLGGGSLGISIVVHAVILALGIFWIVQSIPAPKEKIVDFIPQGGGGGAPAQSPSKQKQRQNVVRNDAARVAAKDVVSNFTLPDPEISTDMSPLGALGSGGLSGGLGGSGSGGGKGDGKGTGFGSGMGPGLGGTGKGNLFGMPGMSGPGMMGTFYDFKRDAEGNPTGLNRENVEGYKKIIAAFTAGRTWEAPKRIPHFASKTKLRAKAFFFPAMQDTKAGEAFQAPETQAGMWVAHYQGTVRAKEDGYYRLIGWGDNCLIVGINGTVKLDASDRNFTGKKYESAGSARMKSDGGGELFIGDWFQLRAGKPFKLDVLIGDMGGIFAAGALLQKRGEDYTLGDRKLPDLPILRVSDLTPADLKLYGGQLPGNAIKGPLFEVVSDLLTDGL